MKMASDNLAMGIFLFSHITVGVLGNFSILFYYLILIFTGKHLMPKDLIIEHLTLANCLSIISRGITQAISDFGIKYFLDNIGCKLIVFIYRITRGMSLYSMSLLSCFQAITINPRNSKWMKLKHRIIKYIGPSCSLGWLLHLLLNILTTARVSGPISNKNTTRRMSFGYCSWFASGNVATALYMFLLSFTDGLCLGLMACSSVSMVNILYRHKREVKYIHSAQHILKVSPEDRAAQTILILVCTFFICYSFSSFLVIFVTYSKDSMLWGVSVVPFLETCFPIVCPFVLISNINYILKEQTWFPDLAIGFVTPNPFIFMGIILLNSKVMGICLFSQTSVGMLGNSSILFYYLILIFNGKHLMPKDLIIEHLTLANYLTVISRGIPQTMSDFGFKYFLDDIGCKLIMYIYRISRGMSLYTMSLLTCFQAITINQSNPRWMKLKHRATKYIGLSCSLGWLVHLLLNILTPARVSGPISNKNVTNRVSSEYCSWFASGNVSTALYMLLLCFTDGLCLGLMACSSVSMVRILYRHKRQVKHIHSAQHFLKVSPEDRATQTILILVCIFVISYLFSSILVIFTTYIKDLMLWELSVFIFQEICFPTFYPFMFPVCLLGLSDLCQ
ncbi:vomeronasal type-1 receptor 4-like, partial [Sigmodon hispidus]